MAQRRQEAKGDCGVKGQQRQQAAPPRRPVRRRQQQEDEDVFGVGEGVTSLGFGEGEDDDYDQLGF